MNNKTERLFDQNAIPKYTLILSAVSISRKVTTFSQMDPIESCAGWIFYILQFIREEIQKRVSLISSHAMQPDCSRLDVTSNFPYLLSSLPC